MSSGPSPAPRLLAAHAVETTAAAQRHLIALAASSTLEEFGDSLRRIGFAPALDQPWGPYLRDRALHANGAWGLSWLWRRVPSSSKDSLCDALAHPVRRRHLVQACHGGAHELLRLLEHAVTPAVYAAVRRQMFEHGVRVAEAVAPTPEHGSSSATWRTWLARFALDSVLDIACWELIRAPSDASAERWLAERGDWTAAELLDGRAYAGERLWSPRGQTVPVGARRDLEGELHTLVVEDLLARSRGAGGDPPDEEQWPRVFALAASARQQLAELEARCGWEWPLTTLQGRFELHLEPPYLTWTERVGRWDEGAEVSIRLSPELFIVRHDADPFRLRRTVLLQLVGQLTTRRLKEDTLAALEADLGRRPIDRFLADLLPPKPANEGEIGWALRTDRDGLWLSPLWCSERASGGWKGRLLKGKELPRLAEAADDPRDVGAITALVGLTASSDRFSDASLRRQAHVPARIALALERLRDHPRLFCQIGPERPLRIELAELELHMDRDPDGVQVDLHLAGVPLTRRQRRVLLAHDAFGARCLLFDEETATARLVAFGRPHRRVLQALDQHGHRFDRTSEDALVLAVPRLQEGVGIVLGDALAGAAVPAGSHLVARLELLPDGLDLSMWTRPLDGGPVLVPGRGAPAWYGERSGVRVHAVRDLDAEVLRVARLAAALGLPQPVDGGRPTWMIPAGDSAAECLSALRDLPDVDVEWQGPAGRVRTSGGFDMLSLRFKALGEWFALEGELDVEGSAIDLEDLLLAIEQGRRFVSLGDGDWLELDATLRHGLNQAAGGLRGGLDGTMSPLHAPVVEELRGRGATFDAPAAWWDHLGAIDAATTLQPPTPTELSAQLRPYQEEGFRWMARLAEWSGGAVLADDMGLGKTVQALALLLRRADGPALVVGPASVGWNWLRETERFAPSLSASEYRGPDRATLLEDLGPGDILITSWDLMARDIDALAEVAWTTVVLDEAQAMKNSATRRHRAARQLQAGFRLALSGTPVENHAGELHALFDVVLPGLLGTKAAFRHRYVIPMQRGQDAAREALAQMISPFILRRTKGQVASDLPPRTDLRRTVELLPAERRLYEQVRQMGLTQLSLAEETGEAQQRMQVLALLTRLRQAACHPRLVEQDSLVPSSKLSAVLDLLDSLKAEGHAVLIFSQFVRHLELVREALLRRGFELAWLTGSTPTERRRAEVDRFQAGGVDAFLISIKAGGVGLNLTAASYVVHLDPWWNPAVEDQATDRAHRIGQTQAVTVYRFVSEGTVEEQILELHEQKRELVEGLLSGAGSSRALSTEEIVALLVGSGRPDASGKPGR
jgi:superfamily II DNA or RNA helicase